jgi:hypothetical protein
MNRKRLLGCLVLVLGLGALPGCAGWDGHFDIFGYTTRPMYDLSITSVRVPQFKNHTFYRDLDLMLTEAVCREIQAKTPYRVIQDCERADTELIGTIVNFSKSAINFNQLGEVREAQTTLGVELVWRDLRPGRSGEILSRPPLGKPGEPPPPPPPPGAVTPPVLVMSLAHFRVELGESMATAQKENVDKLAVQIVSMMEKPW